MKNRIPIEEIEELIDFHQSLRDKRAADRIKCLIYWGKGYSWEEIRELLFIKSDSTLKEYIDSYKEGKYQDLSKNNNGSNNYKLTKEEENRLVVYLEKYIALDSKQVCDYVKKTFNKEYTTNGMTQTLKRLGFSYKKPKRNPPKIDYLGQQVFLFWYYCKLLELKEKKIKEEVMLFMDASGFEHNSRPDYGWFRKGKERSIKSNSGRKKLNVNGVIDPITKEVTAIIQEENVNTQSNINLMNKVLEKYNNKSKIHIILDNAKMNWSKDFKRFIEKQNGKIELHYIPSYMPNLNLIERLWCFSKKKLLSNKYYSSFTIFRDKLINFFDKKIKKYKLELDSLISEKFKIYQRCLLRF